MQTKGESDGKGEIPEDVSEPPHPRDVLGQPATDESKIPLVVFSTAEAEGALGTSGKTDEECSVDCESFVPADLLSFAWQIAGGMVRRSCLQQKFGNTIALQRILLPVACNVALSKVL